MQAEDSLLRLTRFEVVPHLRGQRYGVQLLGQAVQYARTLGLDRVAPGFPELDDYFRQYGFPADTQGELVLDYSRILRPIP